ncbi:HEAT repeat domain-containing protein [Maioricimonas sp. JC845]|uniref:HEAT repeat domain-containing protein n=1 Tax=Maioricimonas sp. JC845 TaxID=3232138 RepID=UPI00345853C8
MTRHTSSLIRRGLFVVRLLLIGSLLCVFAQRPARAVDQAAIDAAVKRGVNWLGSVIGNERDMGYRALAAMALLKGGAPHNHPGIMDVVDTIRKRVQNNAYPGRDEQSSKGMYLVGIEAMLLADLDPVEYRPELQAITDYIIKEQRSSGGWNYVNEGDNGHIDTSVTQYACLGLWAAHRSGIEVPQSVWARVLKWFNTHQQADGGFAYRPSDPKSREGSTLTMTAAAIGTMHLILMHLDPSAAPSRPRSGGRKALDQLKFGVLESVPEEEPVVAAAPAADDSVDARAVGQASTRILARAESWLGTRFTPEQKENGFRSYYIYTIERVGAFANSPKIGAHDWFEECAKVVLDKQESDGSWNFEGAERASAQAAFAILFLTRSTAKSLGRTTRRTRLGNGLLAGGRGLPEDLRAVEIQNGNVQVREIKGPLDELLTELATGKDMELALAQEEVIEKIQFGSREELIGQKEQLLELVEHKDPELRRTALWALGRTDDLALTRLLISALDDPDLSVAIEARNALCWISRRPNGFGLAENPLDGLPPDTPEQEIQAEVAEWRNEAVSRWGSWYLQVRPFSERGDAFEAELRARIGN